MESTIPTYVCPDSKAVVQAAGRMAQGKMSKNPRIQNLLACINRRPVLFHHSSAKLGQHLLSDTCSRSAPSCTVQDCAIERFLDDLPMKINLMNINILPISASDLILQDHLPAITAASSQDLLSFLASPSSALPLGSFDTWKAIQEGDPDSAAVLHCKKSGDTPRKRSTNPTINRFFSAAQVKNGVLVVPTFDKRMMRNVDKVVIPPSYMPTLLTILHLKCNHPSRYQMEQVFQRYFFAPPGLEQRLNSLYEQCYTCLAMTKFRPPSAISAPSSPDHPGTHMQADVMKRCNQLILVNTDLFSNYTTSTFLSSERKQDLLQGLIQVSTPIRRGETITIRTDRAPALEALAKTPPLELKTVKINLLLPDVHFNKNANSKVDKIIQELQTEIRKICPESRALTVSELAIATCNLNNRIRKSGLTASEVQFARDFSDGSNLTLSDSNLKDKNIQDRPRPINSLRPPQPPNPGDLVLIPSTAHKHAAPTPFIVTQQGESASTLHKVLHSHPDTDPPLKLSSHPVTVKNSDLIKIKPLLPPNLKIPPSATSPSPTHPPAKPPAPQWHHYPPISVASDSESEDQPSSPLQHPSHYLPPDPPLPYSPPAQFLRDLQNVANQHVPGSHSIIGPLADMFNAFREEHSASLCIK
jgi:hypothetical protein